MQKAEKNNSIINIIKTRRLKCLKVIDRVIELYYNVYCIYFTIFMRINNTEQSQIIAL